MSNRLLTIANLIESVSVVADIGSDHAKLPQMLIERGQIKRAIASEIAIGPLNNAINGVRLAGLSEQIDLRLGAGCSPYEAGEVDVFVIAGMGGHTISQIIDEAPDVARAADYLILQPMQNRPELRKFLYEYHFSIDCEVLSREGDKFYHVMKVLPIGAKCPSELALMSGVNPRCDNTYYAYIAAQIELKSNILRGIDKAKQARVYRQVKRELSALRGVYHAR